MVWVPPVDYVSDEFVVPSELNVMQGNLRALSPRGLSVQVGTPGGGPITAGVKVLIPVIAAFDINGWSVAADQVGNIAFNLYRCAWADAPPDVADSIVGAEPPCLIGQQFARDLGLTTWVPTAVDAGDVIAVVVDSADTVECVVLTIHAIPR